MIKTKLQNTSVLLLSAVVAIFLLAGIEWLGTILHPFPADFAGTREEVMQHVEHYPFFGLFVGGIGWAITIFIAAWLATRLSSKRQAGYGIGIGVLLLSGAIFNMAMLPYPVWYWALCLTSLPLGIYGGVRFGAQHSAESSN